LACHGVVLTCCGVTLVCCGAMLACHRVMLVCRGVMLVCRGVTLAYRGAVLVGGTGRSVGWCHAAAVRGAEPGLSMVLSPRPRGAAAAPSCSSGRGSVLRAATSTSRSSYGLVAPPKKGREARVPPLQSHLRTGGLRGLAPGGTPLATVNSLFGFLRNQC